MSPCPHIISRDGADYCAVAESTVATLRARLNATESMLAAQNREHLYTLLANGDLMQERDELRARAEAAEAKCAELECHIANGAMWNSPDSLLLKIKTLEKQPNKLRTQLESLERECNELRIRSEAAEAKVLFQAENIRDLNRERTSSRASFAYAQARAEAAEAKLSLIEEEAQTLRDNFARDQNSIEELGDRAEAAEKERDELRDAIKPFSPQHSGLCIDFTHPDRPITEESCQCSYPKKKLMRFLGLLPKGGAR